MKMSLELQIMLAASSIIYLIVVFSLVRKQKIMLKYSLLWFIFGFVGIITAIFPKPIGMLSSFLGFEQTSNFVFFAIIGVLMLIAFSLSIALSVVKNNIKDLTQYISILEKQLDEKIEGRDRQIEKASADKTHIEKAVTK